jgi:DNA/RNA-binding domain of Phe-tRNA-synthetase-like protein
VEPRLVVDPSLCPCPVAVALIWAEEIAPPSNSRDAPGFLKEIVEKAKERGESFWPEGFKERVRKMLRFGVYKPCGRAKPSSEFLLNAAVQDAFPFLHAPVDVNNAVSLESGYPATIFDADLSGTELLLRRGLAGENFVFNSSGQVIDLRDLLVVCRRIGEKWEPCGNPVRDSMATKIRPDTRSVIAVLYAPADEPKEKVRVYAEKFCRLLKEHCLAKSAGYLLV